MPGKKYLDEIEEILRRTEMADDKPRPRRTPKVPRTPPSVNLPSLRIIAAVSPGKLMAAGVGALALAMILRPFFQWLTAPLLWTGLALFILAYVLFLIHPRVPRIEKRWRGRPLEEETSSLWERIRRNLKRL